MSKLAFPEALRVGVVGTTLTSGAASATTTLPVDTAGNSPRFIRIMASGKAYIKLGKTTAVATTNDILLASNYPETYSVQGYDKIGIIDGPDTGVKINIIPLET